MDDGLIKFLVMITGVAWWFGFSAYISIKYWSSLDPRLMPDKILRIKSDLFLLIWSVILIPIFVYLMYLGRHIW